MTNADALALRRGDLIRVRKPMAKRATRAWVAGRPTEHGRWVLVPYRVVVSADTVGPVEHVARASDIEGRA